MVGSGLDLWHFDFTFCFPECCVSVHSIGICPQEGRRNRRDEATPLLDGENQQFGTEKVTFNNLGYKGLFHPHRLLCICLLPHSNGCI